MPDSIKKAEQNIAIDGDVSGEIYQAGGDIHIDRRVTKKERLSQEEHQARSNRQLILNKVEKYWIKGVLEKSMYNMAMLELGLTNQPDLVENPWDITLESLNIPLEARLLPTGTNILDTFVEMERSLLIVGEPGGGKTTMLLELARELISAARARRNEPIPLIFNLSSWDGKLPLDKWLVQLMKEKYGVAKHIGQQWLNSQSVLPLLDGLDEVSAEHREPCVTAINTFIEEFTPYGIAVCSRIADYEELKAKLKMYGAVVISSLSDEQIEAHLTQTGTELASLRNLIASSPDFRELASSPLMLSLMMLAYQGVSAEDVSGLDSVDAHRRRLFDMYIQRMLKRHSANMRYSPEAVRQWLSVLAVQMEKNDLTLFEIENIQPSWLGNFSKTFGYRVGTFLVTTVGILLLTTVLYLAAAFTSRVLFIGDIQPTFIADSLRGTGLVFAAVVFFAIPLGIYIATKQVSIISQVTWSSKVATKRAYAGLVANLIARVFGSPCAFIGLFSSSNPLLLGFIAILVLGTLGYVFCIASVSETRKPDWSNALYGFMVTGVSQILGLVLLYLLIPDPSIYALYSLETLLALGLFFAAPAAIASFLGFALGGIQPIQIEVIEQPYQRMRRASLLAVGLLTLGLIVPLISLALQKRFNINLVGWVTIIWLLVVPSIAVLLGGGALIQHYSLRLILSLRHWIPWHYARFLDHAADDLIFLRKVGGGYIFIHRMLRDHFAEMAPSTAAR